METIVIYSNRKMYSKTLKKYVTQKGHIKRLVIEGADFQVLEQPSGKDVTVNILQSMLADRDNINELSLMVGMINELRSDYVGSNIVD